MRQLRGALELILAGGLLTLSAFAFGAAPLLVPGSALLLLGVLMPAWVWLALRGAVARRRLAGGRVIEDEPFEVVDEISRGRLGLPGGQLNDPLAGHPLPLGRALSPISGRAHAEVHLTVRVGRRGRHRLPAPEISARDPLGLTALTRAGGGDPQELLVLPRVEAVSWPASGRAEVGQGEGGVGEPPAAVDVDGLRPYREGSPASRIHWPALARGAGLLERRLTPDEDGRPLIVLDVRDNGDLEALDAAVRAAASLTLALARVGGCRILLPGERRPIHVNRDLTSWPGIHARLAMVQGGPRTPAPRLGPSLGSAPVLWVAAEDPVRLPAALAGAHDVTLVLPDRLAGSRRKPSGLRVSGCRGFRLGRGSPPRARSDSATLRIHVSAPAS